MAFVAACNGQRYSQPTSREKAQAIVDSNKASRKRGGKGKAGASKDSSDNYTHAAKQDWQVLQVSEPEAF